MPQPEPNPHVELNNAREQQRQFDLIEDKARIDFLEEMGATWHIPVEADGPWSFDRDTIDSIRRKLQ